MDELPVSTDLKDRFLIQAAWKDDPGEDVQAFWKRGPKKDELFQKKFSSELFLQDMSEEQAEEERAEAAAEIEEESVQALEEETAAVEEKMDAYDTNGDGVLDEAELEAAAKAEAQAKVDAEAEAEREAEERYEEEQAAAATAKEEAAREQADKDAAKAAETKAKNAQKAKAKEERKKAEQIEKDAAAKVAAEKLEEEKAAEATRQRSTSSSGPSLAMQISLPDFSLLTSDPIAALGQYATPLTAKLCTTPLKMAIEPAAAAASLPKEFVVFMCATVTLLLMILTVGLSVSTTAYCTTQSQPDCRAACGLSTSGVLSEWFAFSVYCRRLRRSSGSCSRPCGRCRCSARAWTRPRPRRCRCTGSSSLALSLPRMSG